MSRAIEIKFELNINKAPSILPNYVIYLITLNLHLGPRGNHSIPSPLSSDLLTAKDNEPRGNGNEDVAMVQFEGMRHPDIPIEM